MGDREELEMLKPHAAPTINRTGSYDQLAPRVVFMALAALVEPSAITASHTTCDMGAHTRWAIWAVTDTTLAHVEFTFDADNYDWREDNSRERPETIDRPADATLVEVYARPLSAVVGLTFSRCEYIRGDYRFSDHDFRFRDITLTFASGSPVHIELPGFTNQEERDRWDGFVNAIRAGMHF